MKLYIPQSIAVVATATFAAAHPGAIGAKGKDGAPCPYLRQQQEEERAQMMGEGYKMAPMRALAERTGDGGVPEGGFTAVMEDLTKVMTDSQDFWPADFGNYGGLMIRLAWHCSGSYRESDGRGGCDGGRIRFDPELNWMDNGNLDKALKLLEPVKEKYGSSLSWGDLIVLAGNTAIKSMGGPILGFCGGRIDDADGSDSLILGPSDAQEEIAPCQSLSPSFQGKCLDVKGTALGPTTVGLIYVNPEGPIGEFGNLTSSALNIRKAFARMGFDDQTSVALIGGGHAFGKGHGACLTPPCGEGNLTGIGNNTYTAGFEGKWTTRPTEWTNEYFNNMFDFEWSSITGPGGHLQWAPNTTDGSMAPDIFMLTTDLALISDDKYTPHSQRYADNITALEEDFAPAWYRLTSADMGPSTRCIGDLVPAPQWFQYTLQSSPTTLPDYVPIRTKIQSIIDGDADAADAFINLAYRASSTFRATDYRGGVNGARIRFEPESTWPENDGTADALALLEPVQSEYDASYADLIVLAGITALESKNSDLSIPFCGGYVDADNADGSEALAPRYYNTPYITVSDDFKVKGLTPEEGVALASRESVRSDYYTRLLNNDTTVFDEYELALLEGDFLEIVQNFAADETKLLSTFTSAWTKMMTSDRYLNNRENACTNVTTATLASDVSTDDGDSSSSGGGSTGGSGTDSGSGTNTSTGSGSGSSTGNVVNYLYPTIVLIVSSLMMTLA